MPTTLKVDPNNGFVLVIQSGALDPTQIKEARESSLPLFRQCDRALVDYRRADLSGLRLIDLDNLSAEFRQDVPYCKKMAIVRTQGQDDECYNHLRNVLLIKGVDTCLFEEMEKATNWLIEA